MSVLGQNTERDKWAKRIIYGGGTGYFALLGILASLAGNSMGVNPGVVMKAKHSALSKKKSYQDRAWDIYCNTGDIMKAIKIFFWDP